MQPEFRNEIPPNAPILFKINCLRDVIAKNKKLIGYPLFDTKMVKLIMIKG